MGLLTIGAFARAARLTPKALRLYDELGLLPPAAVDPESGYRFYAPEQLERARLIAELRRIGMPLAEIRTVCALEPAAAAKAVTDYWQQVTVDTAARARRASLLVEQLSGGGSMSGHHTTLAIRSAAGRDSGAGRDSNEDASTLAVRSGGRRSSEDATALAVRSGGRGSSEDATALAIRSAAGCDTGAGRESNEDAAYAGDRLLAVADGMRGPGGAAASAAAIDALKPLEASDAAAPELLARLATAVAEADRTVRAAAIDEHQPVTTLTAVLRSGSQLALVHVGDTRVYLLRGGELSQLTRDHTWIQAELDRGRLDRAQAARHPDRALLTRALGAGAHPVEADLALRTAAPGDRYLLCSDGLSSVVDGPALRAALTGPAEPDQIVHDLIGLAHAAGAPDNIACVVADIVAS